MASEKPKIEVGVLSPTVREAKKITQEDVWGNWEKCTRGMIRGRSEENCPIWGDVIPYKSVTVVCLLEDEIDVIYWLEYVHGGDSISKRKSFSEQGSNRVLVALRSDYQCW